MLTAINWRSRPCAETIIRAWHLSLPSAGRWESEANRSLFKEAIKLKADTSYVSTSLRKESTAAGQVDEGILEIAVPIYARGQFGGVVIGSFRIRDCSGIRSLYREQTLSCSGIH